jgi:hypothetical protein
MDEVPTPGMEFPDEVATPITASELQTLTKRHPYSFLQELQLIIYRRDPLVMLPEEGSVDADHCGISNTKY